MSEKKYYVKLKSPNEHRGIWWCGDRAEWQSYSDDPVYGEELDDWEGREVIGWKVSEFIPSFTKSELAEIMGGAIYHVVTEEWECGGGFYEPREWKNPLIELVPMEDRE